MKKKVLLVFVLILFVGGVSASYSCSVGDPVVEQGGINIGKIENINYLKINLLRVFGNSAADFLVDANKITLTNETPLVEFELLDGVYNVSLVNSTTEYATIKIGSESETINIGEAGDTGGLDIFISSLEGTYPGEDARVELSVGLKYFSLQGEPLAESSTINGKKYGFEVTSAFSTGVLMEVTYCENGTLEFVDVVAPPDPNLNDSEINDSTLGNQNDSVLGNQNDSILGEQNDSVLGNQNDSDLPLEEKKGTGLKGTLVMMGYSFVIALVIVLGFFLIRKFFVKDEEDPEES